MLLCSTTENSSRRSRNLTRRSPRSCACTVGSPSGLLWTLHRSTHRYPLPGSGGVGVRPSRRGTGLWPTVPAYSMWCCSAGLAATRLASHHLRLNPLSPSCPPPALKAFSATSIKALQNHKQWLGPYWMFPVPQLREICADKVMPSHHHLFRLPLLPGDAHGTCHRAPCVQPLMNTTPSLGWAGALPSHGPWFSDPLFDLYCVALTIASGLEWVLEDFLLKWKCVWPWLLTLPLKVSLLSACWLKCQVNRNL